MSRASLLLAAQADFGSIRKRDGSATGGPSCGGCVEAGNGMVARTSGCRAAQQSSAIDGVD